MDATTPSHEPDGGIRAAAAHVVEVFYRVMSTGQLDELDQAFHADWVDRTLPPGRHPGLAGMRQAITDLRAGLPDLTATIHQVLVDGDLIASRQDLTGTHTGPLAGAAPTGRPVAFATFDVHRLQDGRIAESWHLEDNLAVITQIAASPQQRQSHEIPGHPDRP
jgi:predicted ester cyclase